MRRKTDVEFKQEALLIHGDEYEYVDQYDGAHVKMLIIHKSCGFEFLQTPNSHLRGRGCPKCGGTMLKTHSAFLTEQYTVHGDHYTALEEYLNRSSKMWFIHNDCGHIFQQNVSHHLKGHGCPKCANDRVGDFHRMTHVEFTSLAKKKHHNEFLYLGQYSGIKNKIKIQHVICGYIYEQNAGNHLYKGYGCPKCSNSIKRTHVCFLKEAKDVHGDEFEYLTLYETVDTKMTMRHIPCGHIFKQTPAHHLHREQGCPKCKSPMSRKARKVLKYLNDNGIKNVIEKIFLDCRDIRPLRFDFYLPDFNILIEYDGKQHYMVNMWGGEEGLIDRQKKDSIKNQYCINENIPLIRIKYDVTDIEGYLKTELEKLGVTL